MRQGAGRLVPLGRQGVHDQAAIMLSVMKVSRALSRCHLRSRCRSQPTGSFLRASQAMSLTSHVSLTRWVKPQVPPPTPVIADLYVTSG